MHLGELQKQIRDTTALPCSVEPNHLPLYWAAKLVDEAGGVTGGVARVYSWGDGNTEEVKPEVVTRAGFILRYLATLCNGLNIDLEDVARIHLEDGKNHV